MAITKEVRRNYVPMDPELKKAIVARVEDRLARYIHVPVALTIKKTPVVEVFAAKKIELVFEENQYVDVFYADVQKLERTRSVA